MYIRSFVTEEGDVKRPKWWTILLPPELAVDLHNYDIKKSVIGESNDEE